MIYEQHGHLRDEAQRTVKSRMEKNRKITKMSLLHLQAPAPTLNRNTFHQWK